MNRKPEKAVPENDAPAGEEEFKQAQEEHYAEEPDSASCADAEGQRPAQAQDAQTVPAESETVQALQEELEKTRENALRVLAEADNIRKRASKEREDAVKYSVANFARDLLGVIDNFGRAIGSVPAELREGNDHVRNLIAGLEAVEKEMLKTFEKNGIQKIVPEGQVFNPNYHEVMFEAPAPGKKPGEVIQVIEPGYVLHERLLRPARVGVARADSGQDQGGSHVDTEA